MAKNTAAFVDDIAERLLKGDRRALARAITLVESIRADHRDMAQALLSRCLPHTGNSIRIGISGTPGVGKSTFIETFGKRDFVRHFRHVAGDLEHQGAAIDGPHIVEFPAVESGAGTGNGAVDIGFFRTGDLGDLCAGRRIFNGDALSVRCVHPAAINIIPPVFSDFLHRIYPHILSSFLACVPGKNQWAESLSIFFSAEGLYGGKIDLYQRPRKREMEDA